MPLGMQIGTNLKLVAYEQELGDQTRAVEAYRVAAEWCKFAVPD